MATHAQNWVRQRWEIPPDGRDNGPWDTKIYGKTCGLLRPSSYISKKTPSLGSYTEAPRLTETMS